MGVLDIDTNNDLLEHICNKYCEIVGYGVPEFIKDDEIDEQDVFDNPNNYIMGRYVKTEFNSRGKSSTGLYIKIFKVAPNFNDIFPNGKYISSMYLSPSHHMSDILKFLNYINNNTCQYYQKISI